MTFPEDKVLYKRHKPLFKRNQRNRSNSGRFCWWSGSSKRAFVELQGSQTGLTELVKLVLKNKTVEFCNKTNNQIHGTGIGI